MVRPITLPTVRGRLSGRRRDERAIIDLLLACLLAVLCVQVPKAIAQSAVPPGTITGLVTDPQGKALSSVPVWAIRTFPLTVGSVPVTAVSQTDVTGKYYFSSLVPGSYRICVPADNQGLLDPCGFSAQPPIWNLQSGQFAQVNVAMTQGTYVHLRFDDPNATAAKGPPIHVEAHTGSSGRRVTFLKIAQDGGGQNFRALVPFGETVQVSIYAGFKVVDSNGNDTSGVVQSIPATPRPTSAAPGTPAAVPGASATTPGTPITAPGTPTAASVEQFLRFRVQ